MGVEYYQTDFASEFKRWAKKQASPVLLAATPDEQAGVLKVLRQVNPFLTLVKNNGPTKRRDNRKLVTQALNQRERK